jgi:hypothetical protein
MKKFINVLLMTFCHILLFSLYAIFQNTQDTFVKDFIVSFYTTTLSYVCVYILPKHFASKHTCG